MDSDNPWGTSSTDASPNLASSSTPPEAPESAPRLSLEAEEEDATWGTAADKVDADETEVEETKEDVADSEEPAVADEGEKQHEEGPGEASEQPAPDTAGSDSEGREPSGGETSSLPPPVPIVSESVVGVEETSEDEVNKEDEDHAVPSGPVSSSENLETFKVPPLAAPEPSEAPPMDDFDDFDDEDDFGEMGEANGGGDGEDDFGDFGDFGDAAPLDESAFEAPAPDLAATATPSVATDPTISHPPVPFTSSLPPIRLDLSDRPTRRSVAPQLHDFLASAWGDISSSVTDEPERQVEGIAQILVTEESRSLLSTLSTLPALKPLDWRRSKIRREHLVSMGIPVNLDDSNDTKPFSSLATSSPRLSGSLSGRPSSAPPGASPLPFASSRVPSRSSTPFADRERTRRSASPPPLDKTLANQLLALKEDDLTLMSLDKLKSITADLEKISVEASEVLTHALLLREKESQDKETYNGMISDLVSAAAKTKTTSAASGPGKGREPKRQVSWDTAAVQKAETLRLTSFTSQTAHALGESIRAHIRKSAPGKAAIVQITSGSTEQLLYFSTTAEGSLLDNKVWAQRKWRSVIRFGKSTASLNVKWPSGVVPSHYAAPELDYACHGGGYPLRVKGVEPIVGVVVVSGLTQEEDHQSIVDVLEKFIQDGEPVSE
ncbi:hypothetical protein JCM3766R1_002394 [Sporobolomyces carnicolor]